MLISCNIVTIDPGRYPNSDMFCLPTSSIYVVENALDPPPPWNRNDWHHLLSKTPRGGASFPIFQGLMGCWLKCCIYRWVGGWAYHPKISKMLAKMGIFPAYGWKWSTGSSTSSTWKVICEIFHAGVHGVQIYIYIYTHYKSDLTTGVHIYIYSNYIPCFDRIWAFSWRNQKHVKNSILGVFTVSRTNAAVNVATSNACLHFFASITFGAQVACTCHSINNIGETLEKTIPHARLW